MNTVENHVCLPYKRIEKVMVRWKTIPLCGWDCLPPARQARSQFPGPAIGHRLIALVAIISDDSASGREWISLLRSEMGDY